MDAQLAFLCDAALESGGKLHALGIGIDTLWAPQVPVRHPRLSLVLGISYGREEVGNHLMELRVVDADGQDAVPAITQSFPLLDPERPRGDARFVLELNDLQFNHWGSHEFRISCDGTQVMAIPLEIAKRPEPPAT